MDTKKKALVIVALLASHGVAGGAGFFIYWKWFRVDTTFIAEQQKQKKQLDDFDAALERGQPPAAVAAASPKNAAPAPPAGWTPRAANFAIQSRGMSRASFQSDAPLETIVGTTTSISGKVHVDLADATKGAAGEITVEIGTLRTGIDARDGHLRGDGWLDTETFPQATFKLAKVELPDAALYPGKTIEGSASGTLTIKGVSHDITAPVTLGYFAWSASLEEFGITGDVMRIQTGFNVKLSDYGISSPQLVGKKVAEDIRVDLNLTAIEEK